MRLPALDPSQLRMNTIGALADTYAQEARSSMVPGLVDERERLIHPHLVEPLGIKQLQEIAKHRGITNIDDDARIASDGQLIPLPQGGFRLRIAAGTAKQRVRFTMAHEIAHTYFSDIAKASGRSRRELPPADRSSKASMLEERFCDAFAARLLLPKSSAVVEFSYLADETNPCSLARQIEQIGMKWGISTLATVIRLNETVGLPEGLVAVVLRWRGHIQTRTDPTCRVESFYPRPVVSWFLPPNRRASTIGLSGANTLFEYWQGLSQHVRARGGFWTLETDDGGKARVAETSAASTNHQERLIIFMKPPGQTWQETSISSTVNYRMYAGAGSKPYCLVFFSVPRASQPA